MKKVFLTLPLLVLALLFFASCGGDSTTETQVGDTESSDTEKPGNTDTNTDTTDSGSDSECGNNIVEDGEICDGDAKACNEINPNYAGFASCKADCTGYDESTCTGNGNDSGDTNPGGDTGTDTGADTDANTGENTGYTCEDIASNTGTATGSEDVATPVDTDFKRFVADSNPMNPAFVTVDDLDEDGKLDMIVCQYGASTNLSMTGRIDIYWGTGKVNQWTRQQLNICGDIKFPHPVKVADLNGDGIKDIVVPGGFLACSANPMAGGDCGVLFWLEGTGNKNQWKRHDIVKMGYDHFFFDVSLVDIDGDGIDDILTNAELKTAGVLGIGGSQDEKLMWFKGTKTPDRFDTTPTIISDGNGGPFPKFVDINGDGKKDIALAQYFNDNIATEGSFLWFEQVDAKNNQWTKHIIDNESGESFMLEIIDDLCGDGVRRAVGVNHVNTTDNKNGPKEGVFIFDIPANPTQPWPKRNVATDIKSRKSPMTGPQAAPGLFGYGDITGNGLIDLVVSGDGDSRVFWFEQTESCNFVQHTLDGKAGASINSSGSFGQAGGMKIVDLDGDGKNEVIVTLYEDNKLYIYKYNK